MSGNGCISDFATTLGKLKSRANGTEILQASPERARSRICLKISRIQLYQTITEKLDTSTHYFTRPTFRTWMILGLTFYFPTVLSTVIRLLSVLLFSFILPSPSLSLFLFLF